MLSLALATGDDDDGVAASIISSTLKLSCPTAARHWDQ